MNKVLLSSLCAGSLFFGMLLGGVVLAPSGEPADPAGRSPERQADLERENTGLREEIVKLRRQLDAERQRVKELADRGKRPEEDRSPPPTPSLPPERDVTLPFELTSMDQADAVFEDALARTDAEALWQLGAVLLSMGEGGYEKLVELFGKLGEEMKRDKENPLQPWFQNELIAGRFLRAVADHSESLLRFSLYLQEKDPSTVPEELHSLTREMHRGLGAVLLGFYDGDAVDIHDGFTSVFERRLESQESVDEATIHALAQLRTEGAADLLIKLLNRSPAGRVQAIIMALAYQGNPRAAQALRAYRSELTDRSTIRLLDSSLRLLE